MKLRPQTVLGQRYEVKALCAMGGQCIVYQGTDRQTGQSVAIKVMREIDDVPEEDARRQFRKEYEFLRETVPGLPRGLAELEHEGRLVMVEEWVDGRTLQQEGCNVPLAQAVRWALELLRILHHLHGRRPPVVVRDIKPSNVIVNDRGAWLIDLTSARALEGPRDTVALGTPGFAAPEQHSGHCGIPSDLFSVGALLMYMLTGLDADVTRLPCRPGPLRRDVSPALDEVVRRATEFEAKKRFQSAREMAAALEQVLDVVGEGDGSAFPPVHHWPYTSPPEVAESPPAPEPDEMSEAWRGFAAFLARVRERITRRK